MPDANNNGIPDRWDLRIVAALGALLAIGQAVQQYVTTRPDLEFPAWAGIAMVAIAAVIPYFVIRGRPRGGNTAMLMILALLLTACPGPYSAAWRTMDGVVRARDATAQALAKHAAAERERCLEVHGQTPAGAACIAPTRKALTTWRTEVRPAVNSALQITAASLQIAERAKAARPPAWMSLLRPAACALLRVAKAWGAWYPDSGKPILTALGAAAEVTCE